MEDENPIIARLREWKANTGSLPRGEELKGVLQAGLQDEARANGDESLLRGLHKMSQAQRAKHSNVPHPDDIREDINPVLGAGASFLHGLSESSMAAGGDLWRTGAQRAADAITDTEIGGKAAEFFRRGVNATPYGPEAINAIDRAIPTTEDINKGRQTADQYRRENFLAGRVPNMAGGFTGLMANVALTKKLTGLPGPLAFGAEEAIVPEIQAEASGTETRAPHFIPVPEDTPFGPRLERMAGRAVEGVALDLLLRGAGAAGSGAASKVLPQNLPGAARVAGGAGQAAALAGLTASTFEPTEAQKADPNYSRLRDPEFQKDVAAAALLGGGMGVAGGRVPPRLGRRAAGPKVEPMGDGPLGSRPVNEARRPGSGVEPEPTPAQKRQATTLAKRRFTASPDPLWNSMVKGDRPSYLIPGAGNKALPTPSEIALSKALPPVEMMRRAGINDVNVPGLGRLFVNTNHPVWAGHEANLPGFIRDMQNQGREHEILGYSEKADQANATHIVTALDKAGNEVASVRTTDPVLEATGLEGVEGVAETVVRPNTPESTLKINKGRLGSLIEGAQAEAKEISRSLEAEQPASATERAPLEPSEPKPKQDGVTPEGLRKRADIAEQDGIHASARDLRKMADEMEAKQAKPETFGKDEIAAVRAEGGKVRRTTSGYTVTKGNDVSHIVIGEGNQVLDVKHSKKAPPKPKAPKPQKPRPGSDFFRDESGAVDVGKVAKRIVSRVKTEVLDPAESRRMDVKAQEKAKVFYSKLNDAVGEVTGNRGTARWIAKKAGLPASDPVVRSLEKATEVLNEDTHARLNQLMEKGSRLDKKQWREVWYRAEHQALPPEGHPLHDMVRETKEIAYAEGELMVRAGEAVMQTIKDLRTRIADMPAGKDRSSLRQLLGTLEGAGKLSRERLEYRNKPGERGFVRRFAPADKKEGKRRLGEAFLKSWRRNGLQGTAKGVERAMRDAYKARKDLSPADAEKAGYAVGMIPLVKTWQRAAGTIPALSMMEHVAKAPLFKNFVRPSRGVEDKTGEWIRVTGPEFGALQGKEVHHSLYGTLEMQTEAGRNGVWDMLRALNGSMKEGSTVLRVPGYQSKSFLAENSIATWAAGMSPERALWHMTKTIPDVRKFLVDGTQSREIKKLVDIDLARNNTDLIDALDTAQSGGLSANLRIGEGKGKEYRAKLFDAFSTQLTERLEKIPKGTKFSGLSRLSQVGLTIRETIINFDYARALGADVSVKPGTAAREVAMISDLIWKTALVRELQGSGGSGFARRMAQNATKTDRKGLNDREIKQVLREWFDPRHLMQGVKDASNFPLGFAYIRYPMKHTFNLLPSTIGGGGYWKRNPFGAAMAVSPRRVIRNGFLIWLMAESNMDREEAEEFLSEAENQAFGGDQTRIEKAAPIWMSEDENGKPILHFKQTETALGTEGFWKENINPASRVIGHPEESQTGRTVRGFMAGDPTGQMIHGAVTGRDPFRGGQDSPEGMDTFALELAKIAGFAGSATAQQWTRLRAKEEKAKEFGRPSTSTESETLFRSLLGVGGAQGYDRSTAKGAAQVGMRNYTAWQRELMEAAARGGKFDGHRLKHPGRIDKDASKEEAENHRFLVRVYKKQSARGRR